MHRYMLVLVFALVRFVGEPLPLPAQRVVLSLPGGDFRVPVATIGAVLGAVRAARDARASRAAAPAARVIPTAEHYVGVPYRWGGTSPVTGFDCSGFVQYVFAKHRVRLPRTSAAQARTGMQLAPSWKRLAAGDLVMFAEDGRRISHVAIYAGRNRIIHSSSSGHGVRYDDLGTRRGQWFVRHVVAARRVTPDARGLMLDLARAFSAAELVRLSTDAPDRAPSP